MEPENNSALTSGTNDQAVQQQTEQQDGRIKAYCMKTKTKNVCMQDAVISRTSRGGYMAQGHDGAGNKMTCMLSQANAEAAVTGGHAKWAEATA